MDIDFHSLEQLIKLAERSDIHSLEITDKDERITIVCNTNDNHNGAHQNTITQSSTGYNSNQGYNKDNNSQKNYTKTDAQEKTAHRATDNADISTENDCQSIQQITSPMIGTFYRRADPQSALLVEVGDRVETGQTLCIIEAMKIMNEIKAEQPCTITEILVTDNDIVEYGQPLFSIACDDE